MRTFSVSRSENSTQFAVSPILARKENEEGKDVSTVVTKHTHNRSCNTHHIRDAETRHRRADKSHCILFLSFQTRGERATHGASVASSVSPLISSSYPCKHVRICFTEKRSGKAKTGKRFLTIKPLQQNLVWIAKQKEKQKFCQLTFISMFSFSRLFRTDTNPGRYHCNYCSRDISNTVRIKCAECRDFDLCLDCFSVGVEIHHHENQQKHEAHHSYYVMVRFGCVFFFCENLGVVFPMFFFLVVCRFPCFMSLHDFVSLCSSSALPQSLFSQALCCCVFLH